MPPARRLSQAWIISRTADLLFLNGGFVLSLALFGLHYYCRNILQSALYTHYSIVAIQVIYNIVLDTPHTFASLVRTFFDKQEFSSRRKFLLFSFIWYLVGPTFALTAYYMNTSVPTALFYFLAFNWGKWHIVRQHWGICVLYKYKNKDHKTVDNWLDFVTLHFGLYLPFVYMLIGYPFVNSAFLALMTKKNYNLYVMNYFSKVIWALYIAIMVAFVLRQLYIFFFSRSSKVNVPKILCLVACLSINIVMFNPWMKNRYETVISVPIVTIFHDVQYHAIIWFYCRNRYHNTKEKKDPTWFGAAFYMTQNVVYYYICGMIYLLIAKAPDCAAGRFSPCTQAGIYSSKLFTLWDPKNSSVMSWATFINMLMWGNSFQHYFIDQFIWKTRKDRDLLKDLKVDGIRAKANENPEDSYALQPNVWTHLVFDSKQNLTTDAAVYKFKFPEVNQQSGLYDGQYVALRAVLDHKLDARFYSLVSPASQKGSLDLLIKQDANLSQHQLGMAHYLDTLKPGAAVEFTGPCGGFDEDIEHYDKITFIVKGTGVAPCIQIVRAALQLPNGNTKFNIVYNSTTLQETYFLEELKQFAKRFPERVRITVVCSEDGAEEREAITAQEKTANVHFETGFVNYDLLEKHIGKKKQTSDNERILMCCSPVMAKPVLGYLKNLDYDPQQDDVFDFMK